MKTADSVSMSLVIGVNLTCSNLRLIRTDFISFLYLDLYVLGDDLWIS